MCIDIILTATKYWTQSKKTYFRCKRDECYSPPKRIVNRSMVSVYGKNKFNNCQKQSKEALFKMFSKSMDEQIKNIFRIAPRTLTRVKVRFNHALDSRARKYFVLNRLTKICSKSMVKHLNKTLAISQINNKAMRTTSSWFLNCSH